MIDGVVFTGRLLFLGKFGAFVVFGGIMVWTGVVEWSRVFTDVHALAEWFQLRHFLKCTIVVVGPQENSTPYLILYIAFDDRSCG